MRLRVSSVLPCAGATLSAELAKPERLNQLDGPVLRFVPVAPPFFPDRWAPGAYRTRLLVGGRLSIGEHTLQVERATADASGEIWHDAGFSDVIRLWEHKIVLADAGAGRTRYTDAADIHAGPLTPFAWLFAQVLYRQRQRQLARLVAAGFPPAAG